MKINYYQYVFLQEATTEKLPGIHYVKAHKALTYDEAMDRYGGSADLEKDFHGDDAAYDKHRLLNVLGEFDIRNGDAHLRKQYGEMARQPLPDIWHPSFNDIAHAHLMNHLRQYAPAERAYRGRTKTFLDKLTIYSKGLHGGDLHKDLRAAADLHEISAWQLPHPEAMRGLFNVSVGQVRNPKFPIDFDDVPDLLSMETKERKSSY